MVEVELYKSGVSVRKIAIIIGVCHKTISKRLKKAGIAIDADREYPPQSEQVDEAGIIQEYGINTPTTEIAKKFNVDSDRILRILKHSGHEIRTSTESVRLYHHREEDKRLDKLDANVAYILGLIAADGTLNDRKVQITLKSTDGYLLDELIKYIGIGSIRQIVTKLRYKGKMRTYHQTRLTICSTPICNSLKQWGIDDLKVDRKIDLPKYEPHIREFMLGFFDGDGVMCKSGRCGYVGNYNVMTVLSEQIEKICGYKPNVLKHGRIFRINIYDKIQCGQFLNWLYDTDCIFRLRRKFALARVIYENSIT